MPGSAVADLAGRVLAGRYLLHSSIGTGASGRVYLAEDTRLRRRVAVKVLHAALADDAAFLRRFRAEAQLAASLSHRNIVTVYDWGEDDVPFMVLELLVGGSLRTMLDQGTLLTVAQAAHVGREVASALEYAHGRDVLHRDIKPANLLFDEHGVVRVADFGLARALAEASWTEPAGGVLGTARYASPEQATGVQLDARSDLYALALVLVESVTGRVPFAADTTIGTLTARTQRSLIAPDDLGPLAAVVDRAGCLAPADRYPDAATMRRALADVADSLPPPGALVLAGMHDQPDPHPTRVVAPAPSSELFDQDATVVEPAEHRPRRKQPEGRRRLVPFVVAAVLVATVALATSAFARVGGAAAITMPGFVGRDKDAALLAARRDGLTATVVPQAAPDPSGIVIGQSPPVGTWSTSRHVRLIVSSGPARVAVPAIVGQPWSTVQKQLDGTGFVYTTSSKYSDTYPTGTVVGITPGAGTSVAPDASLAVVLSLGHAPVYVPDVSNLSFADAAKQIQDVHLKAVRGHGTYSDTVAKGRVVKTSPAIGQQVPFGSTVTVIVSRGPQMVRVPDLHGYTLADAENRLQQIGLALSISGKARGNEVVVSQSPDPNTLVPLDSTTVDLTFGPPGGSGP